MGNELELIKWLEFSSYIIDEVFIYLKSFQIDELEGL